jgi:hypothetical protein
VRISRLKRCCYIVFFLKIALVQLVCLPILFDLLLSFPLIPPAASNSSIQHSHPQPRAFTLPPSLTRHFYLANLNLNIILLNSSYFLFFVQGALSLGHLLHGASLATLLFFLSPTLLFVPILFEITCLTSTMLPNNRYKLCETCQLLNSEQQIPAQTTR